MTHEFTRKAAHSVLAEALKIAGLVLRAIQETPRQWRD
jgi:hypothetical protein